MALTAAFHYRFLSHFPVNVRRAAAQCFADLCH